MELRAGFQGGPAQRAQISCSPANVALRNSEGATGPKDTRMLQTSAVTHLKTWAKCVHCEKKSQSVKVQNSSRN